MDSALAITDQQLADGFSLFYARAGESPRPSLSGWIVSGPEARFRPSQGLQHSSAVGRVPLRNKELGSGRLCH